jgi:hypothetical protein
MIQKSYIMAVTLLLLTLLILAACASNEPETTEFVGVAPVEPVEMEAAEEIVEVTRVAVDQAADEAMAPTPAATILANKSSNSAPPVPQKRLIIKDGNMVVVVVDTETAVDATTRLVVDLGGYIISQHVFNDAQGYRYATMKLAIPVLNFEDAMRTLRTLGDVANESASGDDVTDEFVDLNSRLDNLEATRQRLQSFLDQAETVEQALEVNEELKIIEEEMALIQGRINFLSDRASFSTIDLTLDPWIPTPTPSATPTVTPTYTPTPIPTPHEWRPGDTAGAAAVKLQNTSQGVADFFIYYGIICGPWLLLLALLAFIAWKLAARRPQPGPTIVEVSDEEE